MSSIDANAVIQRLSRRLAELELENAMLNVALEQAQAQPIEATQDEAKSDARKTRGSDG